MPGQEKKSYETPQLTIHGSLAKLTNTPKTTGTGDTKSHSK
jgi:hypothetical protein